MQGRRRFLKHLIASTSLGALNLSGIGLGQNLDSHTDWSPAGLEGEAFWKDVRKQYTFYPNQIYLNSATIGLIPIPVRLAIEKNFASLAQGKYYLPHEPREKVAEFLGADVSEISLTHNTTEGINIIANGLPFRRKDEIIITDHEHVGNAFPWLNRARLSGLRFKVFTPAPTAAETLNRIASLITRRTRIIAVPHITCTTGQILPIRAIASLARSKGIWSFVDGAHGPGSTALDMHDLGCDFYATCGHKWLCAPAGIGMLYIRKEMLDTVEAHMVGAYSGMGWTLNHQEQSMLSLTQSAHRFDYGTQNKALILGLQDAVEFMQTIGLEKIYARGRTLAAYLQEKLLALPHVEMLTPTEKKSRGTIIGFKVKGRSLDYFRKHPQLMHFRVRIVPESNLDSLRISTHLFNTYAELDEFVDFIEKTKP
ncbi:MAG TPA: aminotransferase class V-fold PLP-dependent enzyme [Bacteroidetes bacterium]|nr:aminotransferase class V-fold PLP-dependent enzyme [Bacteroidota bacterium]